MNAEELLLQIKLGLVDKGIEDISLTMYDPDKMQQKPCFYVFENTILGARKRFTITVEDHGSSINHI